MRSAGKHPLTRTRDVQGGPVGDRMRGEPLIKVPAKKGLNLQGRSLEQQKLPRSKQGLDLVFTPENSYQHQRCRKNIISVHKRTHKAF